MRPNHVETRIAFALLVRTYWYLGHLENVELPANIKKELGLLRDEIDQFQENYDAKRGIHRVHDDKPCKENPDNIRLFPPQVQENLSDQDTLTCEYCGDTFEEDTELEVSMWVAADEAARDPADRWIDCCHQCFETLNKEGYLDDPCRS